MGTESGRGEGGRQTDRQTDRQTVTRERGATLRQSMQVMRRVKRQVEQARRKELAI